MIQEDGRLSAAGRQYFNLKFIRQDKGAALEILQTCLINYRPIEAICQLLSGVVGADRGSAKSILRSQGMGDGLTDRALGSLLSLMSSTEVIRYHRGRIEVLIQPSQLDSPPSSVFVSRATPYGNKVWLRRILEECEGFIYWLDKHFLPIALESLWEAADGNRVSEVRILSLRLEQNSGRKALRDYRDLRGELGHRGISLEWRVVDSSQIKDTHDRWIIGVSSARNVPDVGTIYSGNHSELNRSEQSKALQKLFDGYWHVAQPIDPQ
ncbi:hypothetical protein ACIODS_03065 [Micromonospora chalcea]|uniref:hypothetical protein n=1 Tax=Micromonospora chalcea TaxID=1874 RepID=UPI003829F8F2